jgi:hypothetical protein
MSLVRDTTKNENRLCHISIVVSPMPFVVSLSNHERPFDRLRANGRRLIFVRMTQDFSRFTDKNDTETLFWAGCQFVRLW